MRRRAYLGLLGAGLAGGAAGCNEGRRGGDGDARTAATAETDAAASPTERRSPGADVSLPVPESELDQVVARDAIPALVDPAYGPDWSDVAYQIERGDGRSYRYDPSLAGDDRVLGVTVDGRARAYPLTLLNWHEVVNHDAGVPTVVTYCPVCRSGVVADRRIDGDVLTFGVSGALYRQNLVLYDRETESRWSQLLATAIRGPLTGTDLSLRPSTLTTWGRWRADHPDGQVLLPPPASGTVVGEVRFDYGIDVRGRVEKIQERYPEYGPLGDAAWSDTRLTRRAIVIGVTAGDAARAYPLRAVRYDGPINDTVGDRPVVVALAGDDTLVAYDRRVDGETLTFSAGSGGTLAAGGSRWEKLTGEALDGPYEGTTLRSAAEVGQLYWAAWLQFHPDTTVYGVD